MTDHHTETDLIDMKSQDTTPPTIKIGLTIYIILVILLNWTASYQEKLVAQSNQM